jgi:hypothetical protein
MYADALQVTPLLLIQRCGEMPGDRADDRPLVVFWWLIGGDGATPRSTAAGPP